MNNTTFKKFLMLNTISTLLFSASAFAELEKGLIKIKADQAVAYEANIIDPNQVTLILMPGIFRGLSTRTQDALLNQLTEQNINWVSYHFSAHPESIIQSMGNNGTTQAVDTKILAEESRQVVKQLKVEKPLYVSLSYSSTVSSLFTKKEMPLLVEAAPLGKQNEVAAFFDTVVANNNNFCSLPWAKLNPYCVAWDTSKSASYQVYWSGVVAGLEKTYPELKEIKLKSQAVSGYVAMSKAVESYDFSKLNFKEGPERIFIIGQNEEANRKKIQIEAIKAYKEQRGHFPSVFLIKNAGHIIPVDQPVAYISVLTTTIKNNFPRDSAIQLVDEQGQLSPMSIEDLSK